jgi:biopolymer transport protein ExbB
MSWQIRVLFAALFLTVISTANSQEANPPPAAERNEALERLLEDVRQQSEVSAEENNEREGIFSEEQAERRTELEDSLAELQRQTERSQRLRAQFDSNEVLLEELNDTLRIRTGDMGELFGIFRQVAAETSGALNSSLASVESPQRSDRANAIAESDDVPVIDDLRALQLLLLEETVESGRVSRFASEISDATGQNKTGQVVRIGLFTAVSADGYLQSTTADAGFNVLPRQPARRYANSATDFFATTSGTASVAIDPSRGSLLSLVIQSPGLVRQISYGGGIGYTIILIGLAGLALSIWRLFDLRGIGRKVSAQLESDSASAGNPLGRVLAVAAGNGTASIEVLERKLDEAVMRETPPLERFQGIVKVIAGVAPLMGLLGTVVGMIRTFQTITLFGSGDPKLMADGISQALVTTVEGLVVAIPLVFMHALMTDKSRELIEILEEQSAGIIARHTERVR